MPEGLSLVQVGVPVSVSDHTSLKSEFPSQPPNTIRRLRTESSAAVAIILIGASPTPAMRVHAGVPDRAYAHTSLLAMPLNV